MSCWIPHFTSVIHWTLRCGLGLLKQVSPISTAWLAIIDHSIDIGTKKALVVLRLPLAALACRKSAVTLEDCECIGLKVCEQVNGESVSCDLTEIFQQAGTPHAIIKDGDATLNKGVRLWAQTQASPVPIIHDIGHAFANILKKVYAPDTQFQRFIKITQQAAKRLRQTDMAFLIPPKLRSKGRFQSISQLGKWAEKMHTALSASEQDHQGGVLERLHKILPDLLTLTGFIKKFVVTTQGVAQIMEIIKNQGLTPATASVCRKKIAALPQHSGLKQRLRQWFCQHADVQKKFHVPLLVSSDIIESLLGKFKYILERSPQADMNRTVLLIPALCAKLDHQVVSRALSHVSHRDLQAWEQTHIPYTMRRRRRDFFKLSQKSGIP